MHNEAIVVTQFCFNAKRLRCPFFTSSHLWNGAVTVSNNRSWIHCKRVALRPALCHKVVRRQMSEDRQVRERMTFWVEDDRSHPKPARQGVDNFVKVRRVTIELGCSKSK